MKPPPAKPMNPYPHHASARSSTSPAQVGRPDTASSASLAAGGDDRSPGRASGARTSPSSSASSSAGSVDIDGPLRVPGADATLAAHIGQDVTLHAGGSRGRGYSFGGRLQLDERCGYYVEVRGTEPGHSAMVIFHPHHVAAFVRPRRTPRLLIILSES